MQQPERRGATPGSHSASLAASTASGTLGGTWAMSGLRRQWLVTVAAALTILLTLPPVRAADEAAPMPSWTTVTVGVLNLDDALKLWVNDFGFRLEKRRAGADESLARLWALNTDDIVDQALLRSRGAEFGMLHLVQFADPGPPVRQSARVFDSLPKNLDIYVSDMPARLAALRTAGHQFRNETFSEATAPNGITFREMHMPGHDLINIVLLEIMGGDWQSPADDDASDFAGVGPLILIVDDADSEQAFYRDVMGLKKLSDNLLEGPEIERMIGLPRGAALDVTIWGRADRPFGQIEVIEYRGVEGNNLYARARPPSRGVLHVSYETPSLAPLRRLLDSRRIDFSEHGIVDTLFGRGAAISFYAPSGFRIEVHERR